MRRTVYIHPIALALTGLIQISGCSNGRTSSSSGSDVITTDVASTVDSRAMGSSNGASACMPSLCTQSSSRANCAFYSCNTINSVTDQGTPIGTCKEWVGAATLPPAGAPPQMLDAIKNGCESGGGIFSPGPCPCDDLVATCHVLSGGADNEYADRFYANFGGGGDDLASALSVVKALCNEPSEWLE